MTNVSTITGRSPGARVAIRAIVILSVRSRTSAILTMASVIAKKVLEVVSVTSASETTLAIQMCNVTSAIAIPTDRLLSNVID